MSPCRPCAFTCLVGALLVPFSRGAETVPAFKLSRLLEEKGETSASVSVADLNGDGHLDLVLAKGRHWPLHNRVLLNDGTGRFAARNLDEAADRTYSAAVADVDGDGKLDMVVSNDRPDRKLVYRGDGQGGFRVSGTFGDPAWPTRYVTLADLNGDGLADIVAANRAGGGGRRTPSYICFNDGKGNFPTAQPLPTESATIILAADFDGDGGVDLFVPHRDGGTSVMFWNQGKGVFAEPIPVGPSPASIRAAAAGDVDGDGRLDLVVGDETTKRVVVWSNVGRRAFREGPALADAAVPYAIVIADVTRDGKPDIIVGNLRAPGFVFHQTGGTPAFRSVRWNDGAGAIYGIAVGDMNGDGWPDLVTARSDAPNAIWFGP
jgi:hypothetical protein